jgi:hypothetical protein
MFPNNPPPNVTINITQNFYLPTSNVIPSEVDVVTAAPPEPVIFQAPPEPVNREATPEPIIREAPPEPIIREHEPTPSTPSNTPPNKMRPRKRKKVSEPRAVKAKAKIVYSNKGFSSLMSSVGIESEVGNRVVARSRVYSSTSESYGSWTVHRIENDHLGDGMLEFGMRGGGSIKFFPNLVPMVNQVAAEMKDHFKSFKQYKVRECSDEPRLHALFSGTGSGYGYGRVQMQGNPLSSLPIISAVAEQLAAKFHLKNREWNIGCHLVLYRNGRDSINWHADDTQGEDTVASLTVDGQADDARTICFQPASSPENGDQQLELFPMKGDVYTMDELDQKSFVHAMMKTKESSNNQRMAIIFRNGESKICQDNGWHVEDVSPSKPYDYVFGNMAETLQEGECYSREHLLKCNAHVARQGNIAGNMKVGCPSIIVKALL